ncbi:hypothetical protein G7083_07365 [Vibrio sp. HDW18]|uniref:lipase family protein n=1 Tax=Vibrio sp. HDW18 TaxID=2714948 RepID=UPI00140CAA7E|nr:hypothetical protein [Vibrio sp. HDW18]QIL85690.1 hypothetical protein G7083_07365 [Vibrio sp. HDW18]
MTIINASAPAAFHVSATESTPSTSAVTRHIFNTKQSRDELKCAKLIGKIEAKQDALAKLEASATRCKAIQNKRIAYIQAHLHCHEVKLDKLLNQQEHSLMTKILAPTDHNTKKEIQCSAMLASFAYHQDLDRLHSATDQQWSLDKPLITELAKEVGLKVYPAKGMIIDSQSGLVGFVFHNHQAKELRLVFGGTSSGKATGSLMYRSISNFKVTMHQWGANAKNAITGKTPDSYAQAQLIAETLTRMISSGDYKDYRLSLSGHSKGAGEAAYAAAMISTPENPVKAECFCSAELGSSMLQDIHARFADPKQAKQAVSEIQHYKIQGDPVPNVHRVKHDLEHVGKIMTLPHTEVEGANNMLAYHDKFDRQIAAWLSNTP